MSTPQKPTKGIPDEVDSQIRFDNSLPEFMTDKIFEFVRGLTEPMPAEEFFALRKFWQHAFDFFGSHHDNVPEAQSAYQFMALLLSATNHRHREIAPLPDSPYPTVRDLIIENEALKARVAELEAFTNTIAVEQVQAVRNFTGEEASKVADMERRVRDSAYLFGIKSGWSESGFLDDSLTFTQYQLQAHETAVYKRTIFEGLNLIDDGGDLARLLKISYTVLGLAGEVGEFANIVKKIERDGKTINQMLNMLVDELGDVLWYVFACADEIGVPVEHVALANIKKLAERKRTQSIQDNGKRNP